MNTWNTPSRPRSTRWGSIGLALLSFSGLLGFTPGSQADSLVEQCLLSGRVTRIVTEDGSRLMHVSLSQPRSSGSAPCLLGRSGRTQRVRFSVPGHSCPEDMRRGTLVEYRYTRFEGGEISWEPRPLQGGPEK